MASWHTVGSKTFAIDVEEAEVNPITKWEVYAPSKVKAGQSVTVTVKAYAKKQTQIKATVTLFGQTQSKTGYAYSTTTPGILTFTFTAPSREDRYTGKVTLYAYY